MSNTTRFGLRAPDGPENADVPLYIRNLASDVDPWLSRAQPRTQAQITAIASPLSGQLVFNTDLNRTQEWTGAAWRSVGSGASGTTNVTTTATGADTAYSFFVGTGFAEVDWQATVTSDVSRGFGAAVTSNAAVAILRSNGAGTVFTMTAAAGATNAAGNRVPDTQAPGVFLFNCYYTASTGLCYFSLSGPAAVTQRINWRAR